MLKGWLLIIMLVAGPAYSASPVVLITSPVTLKYLEQRGYSFGEQIAGSKYAGLPNAGLYPDTAYRDIVELVYNDLDEFQSNDWRLGTGMHRGHRLFDARWLKSPDAYFELIGIVNRMDRMRFSAGHCGEIRLVYRLAYRIDKDESVISSRLPMTVNVVAWAGDKPDGADCRAEAKRWEVTDFGDTQLAAWAERTDGPLHRIFSFRKYIKSIEVNFQSVRWPSTIRGDMAGHAEYVLRVFHFDSSKTRLLPARLENTPDVTLLQNDNVARKRLLAWLRQPDHLDAMDSGVATLPTEFLATRAISVSPRGFARMANRPFSNLFKPNDFADLPLHKKKYIASPAALLRRLDDMSCMGCHQARSTAGFHLLGQDPISTPAANALASPISAHLAYDLARRRSFVARLAGGAEPPHERPLSERAEGDNGFGAHCGRGDPGFKAWGCARDLTCQPNPADERDPVGRCLTVTPTVGGPCEPGTVVKAMDPHDDTVKHTSRSCGRNAVCQGNRVGFPAGMCSTSCDASAPDMVCGGIAQLGPFNKCLSQERPFTECLTQHVSKAGLRMCNDTLLCRDDYICGRTSSGVGACIPPYFIFQMRVDGHPEPTLDTKMPR